MAEAKRLCKNCIHYKVCLMYLDLLNKSFFKHNLQVPNEEAATDCEHYKEDKGVLENG